MSSLFKMLVFSFLFCIYDCYFVIAGILNLRVGDMLYICLETFLAVLIEILGVYKARGSHNTMMLRGKSTKIQVPFLFYYIKNYEKVRCMDTLNTLNLTF